MVETRAILPGLNRRLVLKLGIAGAGLLVFPLPSRALPELAGSAQEGAAGIALNAYVRIAPDNSITVALSQSEMGQGISTTLAAALADELGADWEKLKLEFSPFGEAYQHPKYHWMFTGNSESIMSFYDVMRQAGAAARAMLVAAAAARLGVEPAELAVRDGKIRHAASSRVLTFADVAAEAAKLSPPAMPSLKPAAEQSLIGRPLPRWDIPAKVDGSAVFGIDVVVPDMLSAAVRCAPALGARLLRYDAAAIRAKPGVVATVEVPNGLAVVAETYWQARRALDEAQLTWSDEPRPGSDELAGAYRAALESGPFHAHQKIGDAPAALAGAARRIEAIYELPFQAHATMEPMNCTAHVREDGCDLWIPTQGVELTLGVAQQVTGLPREKIRIHRTLIGGGFGRRLLADFAKQALIIARAVGRPVKLIWSREEDMTHDFYRPAMLHRISAGLGRAGEVTALAHRVVSPSHLLYVFPRGIFPKLSDWTEPASPPPEYDPMACEGLIGAPYSVPNVLVEQHYMKLDLPVSVWRTTGHGPNNFVLESFIDELAAAVGAEPLTFRRRLLGNAPRARGVLDLLAEKANWAAPPPSGRSRGLALAAAFGGFIAQAAEVSVKGSDVKVHRIVSAVDCGRVLDPGIAVSNIMGGIVWGLSGLRTGITFQRGAAQQSNFDAFEPVHLWETPTMEVHFVDSREAPGGTGELGPVPTHAAVANAIFAATGKRLRALPIGRAGLQLA